MNLRANVEAGLTMRLANGWRLAIEIYFKSIGDDKPPEAYGGSMRITVHGLNGSGTTGPPAI